VKKGDRAAASYRNSSFLVVPQNVRSSAVPRTLGQSISSYPTEARSFQYFQLRTLPSWTEFFSSELWSKKVLQLSHTEPAIKHGILALSTMHERYENTAPIFSTDIKDSAFVQYVLAVKHSNALLKAHQEGKAGLEVVLIACIIFTCYENLAGNYKAADMHLQNGLRILHQHKGKFQSLPNTLSHIVANTLYRFDLQAMTFSYNYVLSMVPAFPQISVIYRNNEEARDDLVGILRCMMWVVGVVEQNPQAIEHPSWIQTYEGMTEAFDQWMATFSKYQENISALEKADPRFHAGNTLLKMAALFVRAAVGSRAGLRSEMEWDAFNDTFKGIVDLAEMREIPAGNTFEILLTYVGL
jgi:hypothetical protein